MIIHKSKRPVKSIGASEILAAVEAIDERKVLKKAMSKLLGISLRLVVTLYSRDFFTSLSMQTNSIDESIRTDVNCIRYEYETRNADDVIWIPGKVNLTDPSTDCPLTQAMVHTMAFGNFFIDLFQSATISSDQSFG